MEVAGNFNIADPGLYQNSLNLREWDHSENIDELLGVKCLKIEKELAENQKFEKKTWKGLHPQVLQTPYSQILQFLSLLKRFTPRCIIDFGAAYGRVAFVMQSIFPDAKFIGYEVIEARYQEAKRLFDLHKIKNASMKCEDITKTDFEIPTADVYFIYDFSEPRHIRSLINRILNQKHNDFFIIARGRGIRSIIQNEYRELWAAYDPIHDKDWSLYSHYTDLAKL